jgi:uncharacterized membrane protein (UPF0127 family)
MRKILTLIVLIVILAGGVFAVYYYRSEALPPGPRLIVGSSVVVVEIADDAGKRERGLSGREELGKNEGMLFIFSNQRRQTFWMKEMMFAIDIVFINNGRVIEMVENVLAPKEGEDGRRITASSKNPAEWVLEVNSGWAEKNGIKVGDAVQLIKEE